MPKSNNTSDELPTVCTVSSFLYAFKNINNSRQTWGEYCLNVSMVFGLGILIDTENAVAYLCGNNKLPETQKSIMVNNCNDSNDGDGNDLSNGVNNVKTDLYDDFVLL